MLLRVSTCLVAFGLTTAIAQAQSIPSAFHGMWAAEDCEPRNQQIMIDARSMSTSKGECTIQPGTLRQRSSGISFQSRCTDVREPGVANGFTVLEFEAGHGRSVLIRTHFINGVMHRQDVRPDAIGRCIRDTTKQPYRFTTMEEPPLHWRAYEPQRASRLMTGEPSFDATLLRRDGNCINEFCTTHNEAERCDTLEGHPVCTVLYTENNGTKLYRGRVNIKTGALESQLCIANCRGQVKRKMTLADIDTDFDESEEKEPD